MLTIDPLRLRSARRYLETRYELPEGTEIPEDVLVEAVEVGAGVGPLRAAWLDARRAAAGGGA